jgi:hypothetical protein
MRLFLYCSSFGLGFIVLTSSLLTGITEVYVKHKLVHEDKKILVFLGLGKLTRPHEATVVLGFIWRRFSFC